MPFGRKLDSTERYDIDFDDIYQHAVKPAADAASVDVIRADEEQHGGFIHAAMYERLLLAEIVLADLTLSNPNVFYELGVRHAARPRSTILMYAKVTRLPFDIAPMQAIPYELTDSKLAPGHIAALVKLLSSRIDSAKTDPTHTDSPLFQLVPGVKPLSLPHEATESFRDRATRTSMVRDRLKVAIARGGHDEAEAELRAIAAELHPFDLTPPELLVDLALAFRAISAWDLMVTLIDALPATVRALVTLQEQLAMALNRRNALGDRDRAIGLLRALIAASGPSPETCGILGRVYKDLYGDYSTSGKRPEAAAALDESIRCYTDGFLADPRDYYPGINAITLSLLQDHQEARSRVQELMPVVAFAVTRRGGVQSNDYWDVATVLELSAIARDWPLARRAAARASMLGREAWMPQTTLRNLGIIEQRIDRAADDAGPLGELSGILRARAAELTSGQSRQLPSCP